MLSFPLIAVLLAMIAGVLAGRAWAAALRRSSLIDRAIRRSPHYQQGLFYLASGQTDLALSEFAKVGKQNPTAVEVMQILGNLMRENGQVERAIKTHQALLARPDLSRRERVHTMGCLGLDYQKAGFVDRAGRSFGDVLALDPGNLIALLGMQKLHEEQHQWPAAFAIALRLSRQKRLSRTVLGYLQAEIGAEAARAGDIETAEGSFRKALSFDRCILPAHLGLADLWLASDPRKAAAILEQAIKLMPERSYLAFDRLTRAYTAMGDAQRFASFCEQIVASDPRDWRARVALARLLRENQRGNEAYGLLLKAVEFNPQVLLIHFEMWRTLRVMHRLGDDVDAYVKTATGAAFYMDPHICTACRYRADDMLWRCPHCHAWGTFVDERLGPLTNR